MRIFSQGCRHVNLGKRMALLILEAKDHNRHLVSTIDSHRDQTIGYILIKLGTDVAQDERVKIDKIDNRQNVQITLRTQWRSNCLVCG